MSQSAKMMRGDFPPSSREHFLRLDCAAAAMICLPTPVEPVKPILRMCGCDAIALPTEVPVKNTHAHIISHQFAHTPHTPLCVFVPEPVSTLMTPGGNPASRERAASLSAVKGVTLAGLMTATLPAARHGDS